ncbi:gamma-glutamyl-gamma-aminobutyrate hydrolase family protein [Butyrivibrio sp. VCD2006]|uniref:gamma-glutamyl-gamma-aminobutyrate hydrolase family protein n=1 Tax=Butyrivibrio sp. VCD2006 TaxID=1280664 RepID=UPI0004276FC0|nr:gamma-glutamyl-gamma-aminobutyrate hydrolase family protein [Butyrivibrio sp. VCD2006]
MRPVIGLIPLFDDEKDSYWMLPGYMKVLEKCAALPIMLPLTTDEAELSEAYSLCDGILFTGGHDVSPSVYGEDKKSTCGATCEARDKMEGYLLEKCIADNKPLLGICRGIQFINAYLGGTLYQDLPSEYASVIEHHMSPPYDRAAHKVEILEGTQLSDILGAGIHEVNSYHHQAVKELSPKAERLAVSEDGLIEAIAVKNHRFAIGVQWHPEFSYENNEESVKLVKAFVQECQKGRSK